MADSFAAWFVQGTDDRARRQAGIQLNERSNRAVMA